MTSELLQPPQLFDLTKWENSLNAFPHDSHSRGHNIKQTLKIEQMRIGWTERCHISYTQHCVLWACLCSHSLTLNREGKEQASNVGSIFWHNFWISAKSTNGNVMGIFPLNWTANARTLAQTPSISICHEKSNRHISNPKDKMSWFIIDKIALFTIHWGNDGSQSAKPKWVSAKSYVGQQNKARNPRKAHMHEMSCRFFMLYAKQQNV